MLRSLRFFFILFVINGWMQFEECEGILPKFREKFRSWIPEYKLFTFKIYGFLFRWVFCTWIPEYSFFGSSKFSDFLQNSKIVSIKFNFRITWIQFSKYSKFSDFPRISWKVSLKKSCIPEYKFFWIFENIY